jgi:hypothetical protein
MRNSNQFAELIEKQKQHKDREAQKTLKKQKGRNIHETGSSFHTPIKKISKKDIAYQALKNQENLYQKLSNVKRHYKITQLSKQMIEDDKKLVREYLVKSTNKKRDIR